MKEEEITKNKFRVTFEFETIPYNEETSQLMGGFMSEYPVTTFAKEDLGAMFQDLTCSALQEKLELMTEGSHWGPEETKKLIARCERKAKIYEQMAKTFVVELVEEVEENLKVAEV